MLVEINLIQRHERKNRFFNRMLIFIVFLILAIAGGTYYYTSELKNDIEATQKEYSLFQAERAKLQGEINQSGINELKKLGTTVAILNMVPIESSDLIKNTVALLPDDGYLQTLQYAGDQILLQVQFADDLDAANYLVHLNSQDWISTARLSDVTLEEETTNEIEEENPIQSTPIYQAQFEITLNLELLRGTKVGGAQ